MLPSVSKITPGKKGCSQLNNEIPCVLFKRTFYGAKKKWLKVCKTINQKSFAGNEESRPNQTLS